MRFVHIPTMLGSYSCEYFDVIVVERANGEHIEQVSTAADATMYAYKLLKVIARIEIFTLTMGS